MDQDLEGPGRIYSGSREGGDISSDNCFISIKLTDEDLYHWNGPYREHKVVCMNSEMKDSRDVKTFVCPFLYVFSCLLMFRTVMVIE